MKHPLHPMIVHFPIACWSLATLGDLLSIFIDLQFDKSIAISIAIGCSIAIIAMIAGFMESLKISKKDKIKIEKTLDMHMYLAMTCWCLYVFSLMRRWDNGHLIPVSTLGLISSFTGFICLAFVGIKGGDLVYKYGVGKI